MKKKYLATLLFITTLALTLFAFGCDSQGPAEKVGESIDEAADQMKESVKPKN